MRKEYKVSIIVGAAIGLVCLSVLLAGWVTPHWSMRLQDANVKDVLNLVLSSHTRWSTVQGIAIVTWHGDNGDIQSHTTDFAFQQPARARVTLTEGSSFVEQTTWISDGEYIYEEKPQQRTYSQSLLPAFSHDTEFLPSNLSETSTEFIYLHPMALLTPSPISEFIFPHGFAQGNADTVYKLVGEGKVAGRDAWIMTMTIRANSVMAWVDKETGVILKYNQEINGNLFEEFELVSVEFNSILPANTFSVDAGFEAISPDSGQ